MVDRRLKASDRCDRCGARAVAEVCMMAGPLLFCGHHFDKYSARLLNEALYINDERVFAGDF